MKPLITHMKICHKDLFEIRCMACYDGMHYYHYQGFKKCECEECT